MKFEISGHDISTITKLKILKSCGIDVCYDFHAAFTLNDITDIAPYIKYAFFSCSHLSVEEIQQTLHYAVSCGCSLAIGTRGEKSLFAWDGKQLYEQKPLKVEAKDTLGAGDSFISAFLANYLSAEKSGVLNSETRLEHALKHAADYAAQVVQIEGSLGFGFDADPDCLSKIVNLSNAETTEVPGI